MPVEAPAHPVILRAARISKTYGRVRALDEVGFTLRAGEILGLIGPNGSGKTTLFECLAGVLPADAPIAIDPRPDLFYLPDAIAPWPTESVRWALDFAIGFFGGRADLRGRVVEDLALAPLLDVRIGALSKGQRKRALLGVALLHPAPVLLVDEPFDGLDLRQMRDVARTLRAHAADGRTLLLSIHQIADAARVCDRFVLLSGGRVRGEGTVGELRALTSSADASLEEVFLALT